jgi:hypothetical protein
VTPRGKEDLEQFFTPLLSIVAAHNGCFFFNLASKSPLKGRL